MQIIEVDGIPFFLNDSETEYWTNTGNFVRIVGGDLTDQAYRDKRSEMFANDDEEIYIKHCAPLTASPPMMLRATKSKEVLAYRNGDGSVFESLTRGARDAT